MDTLDRLAPTGADLLARVDGVLRAQGAPADHPIWPLLRAVGALPSDVLRFTAALGPASLAAAGSAVHRLLRGYEYPRAASPQWTGPAGAVFADHAATLAAEVAGAVDRLGAAASYADAVATWARETRAALARTLAGALGSAQAVTVGVAAAGELDGEVAIAAADIGAAVLRVARAAITHGDDLAAAWAPRLAGDTVVDAVGGVPAGGDADAAVVRL